MSFIGKIFIAASCMALSVGLYAQELKSGPYELPYKNTYVKDIFVAENAFRTAAPETLQPGSFEQAKKILPSPVWEGHDREIDMY